MDKAGPGQNTHCLAFAVQQAPIDLASMKQNSYNFMQFRVNSGGMEIGAAWFTGDDLPTTPYRPFGDLNAEGAIDTSAMDTTTWSADPSGMFLSVYEPGDGTSTVFATPSGTLLVDTPNGNIICLKQAATKDFNPAHAGVYKAVVYFKNDAQELGGVETGTVCVDLGTMTITESGHLAVTNEAGRWWSTRRSNRSRTRPISSDRACSRTTATASSPSASTTAKASRSRCS